MMFAACRSFFFFSLELLMDFSGKSLENEILKYSKLLFYWEINGTLNNNKSLQLIKFPDIASCKFAPGRLNFHRFIQPNKVSLY